MTTVTFTYTPTLNVCVSSKSGVTMWVSGAPAKETRRYATGQTEASK